jgi:hypothetical protein
MHEDAESRDPPPPTLTDTLRDGYIRETQRGVACGSRRHRPAEEAATAF